MTRSGGRERRRTQSGQVVVIVAFGMIALIGMVGLVLDGGSSFGQRRAQQRGADLAALAGANDLLLNNDPVSAEAVARDVASQNGYAAGNADINVLVTPYYQGGGSVKVDVTARHQNSFSTIFGLNSWNISASGTAIGGRTTKASGAGPMLFSVDNFQANGEPNPSMTEANCPAAGCRFGSQNGDSPVAPDDIAWTNFGWKPNVNSSDVADIVSGSLVVEGHAALFDYIGQHNTGNHTSDYDDVQQYLAGRDVLVPVTTQKVPGIPNGPASCGGGAPAGGGCFMGWAIFHVVSAQGGNTKSVFGYFTEQKFTSGGTVENCVRVPIDTCPRFFGSYSLYLAE